MGVGIEYVLTLFEIEYHYQIAIIVGSINLIIGMLWLRHVISDPIGDQMFFIGPVGDQDGDIRVGCLWVSPIILSFYSLIIWVWAIVLRFIVK